MSSMFKILMLLSFILFVIPIWTTKMKKKENTKSMTPFECGFNKMKTLKNSMSINFLNFLFLFLMLEMEVIIIIPITKEKKNNPLPSTFLMSMIMLTVLMMLEWKNLSIKWVK